MGQALLVGHLDRLGHVRDVDGVLVGVLAAAQFRQGAGAAVIGRLHGLIEDVGRVP